MKKKIVQLEKGGETMRMGFYFQNEEGLRTFYVRFYVDEVENEYLDIFQNMSRQDTGLYVTIKDGTYQITDSAYGSTWWDILFRKSLALSKQIRKDKSNAKFHPIRMSDSHIEPCERLLAAY